MMARGLFCSGAITATASASCAAQEDAVGVLDAEGHLFARHALQHRSTRTARQNLDPKPASL